MTPARDQAVRVELEAEEALYLPKIWWHKVESLAPLNGLVTMDHDTGPAKEHADGVG